MKYLGLILKNLGRSKRRTILTILSIGVSLFVFAVLISVPAIVDRAVADTASSVRLICINKAGMAYGLPAAYRQKIAALPHVRAVIAQSWFGGIYHEESDQFPNLAIDSDQTGVMWPDWNISPQALNDFQRLRTAALVGPGTMRRFHFHVGQQIMLRSPMYRFNLTLKIVGVTGGRAPANFLLFRRDYLEEALGRPGFVVLFVVRADRTSAAPQVIDAIDRQFANSSAQTQTESDGAFMGSLLEGYRALFRFAELIGLVLVLSIGLVAANTAAMGIRERRAEIAVMRAIGFRSGVVMALVIAEAMVIGAVGGLLACAGALGALHLLSSYANAFGLGQMAALPASIATETMAVAILVGFVSAYFPARSAVRRSIVDALRSVA